MMILFLLLMMILLLSEGNDVGCYMNTTVHNRTGGKRIISSSILSSWKSTCLDHESRTGVILYSNNGTLERYDVTT